MLKVCIIIREAFKILLLWRSSFEATVTVTEALVLCPLLEDRGRTTESICILVPVDRMKQKCFQITTKPPVVYLSSCNTEGEWPWWWISLTVLADRQCDQYGMKTDRTRCHGPQHNRWVINNRRNTKRLSSESDEWRERTRDTVQQQ